MSSGPIPVSWHGDSWRYREIHAAVGALFERRGWHGYIWRQGGQRGGCCYFAELERQRLGGAR